VKRYRNPLRNNGLHRRSTRSLARLGASISPRSQLGPSKTPRHRGAMADFARTTQASTWIIVDSAGFFYNFVGSASGTTVSKACGAIWDGSSCCFLLPRPNVGLVCLIGHNRRTKFDGATSCPATECHTLGELYPIDFIRNKDLGSHIRQEVRESGCPEDHEFPYKRNSR
jgi:hypothetical protein